MCLTVRRAELCARYAQPVVFECAIGVDNPARQDGQAALHVGRGNLIEVEPLAARVGTGKLLGQKLAAPGIGFPCNVPRRIAFVVPAQAGEVFLSARVMLPVPARGHRRRRLGRMGRRRRVDQAIDIHVQPGPGTKQFEGEHRTYAETLERDA